MKITFYLNVFSNNALSSKDKTRTQPQLPMEMFFN